jgi:hypothetical protein
VHSLSEAQTLKKRENAARYADWRFVYEPRLVTNTPSTIPPPTRQ